MWGFRYLQTHSLLLNCLCVTSRINVAELSQTGQCSHTAAGCGHHSEPPPLLCLLSDQAEALLGGKGPWGLQHPHSGSGAHILAAGMALLLPEGEMHAELAVAKRPACPHTWGQAQAHTPPAFNTSAPTEKPQVQAGHQQHKILFPEPHNPETSAPHTAAMPSPGGFSPDKSCWCSLVCC